MRIKHSNLKALLSILAIFTVFFLSSCEEETPTPDQQGDNSTTSYVKEVTNTDGSYETFIYDDSNRLIKIESSPESMSMMFSYDDQGKMSEMQVIDSEGNNTIAFEYNADNVLIAANSDNGLASFTYEYDNNKLIRVNTTGNIPVIGSILMVKTEFDYSGDNVSEFREYTYDFMADDMSLSEKVSYSHDNKKNPFAELGISKAIINIGYETFASLNNCTKRTVEMSTYGDAIGSYDLSYEYNELGYPESANDGTTFSYYE